MFFVRIFILILFLVALAGPRVVLEQTVHHAQGIDIVLTIDISGSMAAEDFVLENKRVNRLAVVKSVVEDFIKKREHDRIGLVAFGTLAYTVCPLTTDYVWLLANLNRLQLGLVEDGTAIGSGINSSLIRLENSEAKSKVIILLTDGVNNAGKIDPLTAARIAKSRGIKVYTIGAGSKGYVPFPAKDFFGRTVYQKVLIDLDEEVLQQIASLTHGKYFRATDTQSLEGIYEEIDRLEKSEIKEIGYREYKELFEKFLFVALGFLLLEIVLSRTVLLQVP